MAKLCSDLMLIFIGRISEDKTTNLAPVEHGVNRVLLSSGLEHGN
jgi:hypothetical protein